MLLAKLLITLGALLYGLGVPLLEINPSHVFNPSWEAHARLHEVWQLTTNSALALLSLWLVWVRNDIKFAYLVRDGYGGSMVLSDGSEKLLFGLNLGAFAFSLVFLLSLLALYLGRRAPNAGAQQ